MHQILGYSAFGWLSLSGVLHFVVDVVSHHYRGKRLPGLETTYYYGMHTAYALGQVLFGLLGIWIIRQAPAVFDPWPAKAICVAALLGWTIFGFKFIEYWEPKMNMGIFGVLLALALVKRP